jgi:hypothetical protein
MNNKNYHVLSANLGRPRRFEEMRHSLALQVRVPKSGIYMRDDIFLNVVKSGICMETNIFHCSFQCNLFCVGTSNVFCAFAVRKGKSGICDRGHVVKNAISKMFIILALTSRLNKSIVGSAFKNLTSLLKFNYSNLIYPIYFHSITQTMCQRAFVAAQRKNLLTLA